MPSVGLDVDAPLAVAWALLTDTDRWPEWGPTVADARLDGPFLTGTTGRVRVLGGPSLRFQLTGVVPLRRWSWRVAGVTATSHVLTDRGADGCRVDIGVPVWATPYLSVCRLGLGRLRDLAEQEAGTAG